MRNSLIVLNVVAQNQHIFKDAHHYNAFKNHCGVLKAGLEAAPKPADAHFNVGIEVPRSPLAAPPKCWTYRLT